MGTVAEQFSQAGVLMIVGMIVVFSFLGLLVAIVGQMEKLAKIFPDKVESKPTTVKNNTKAKRKDDNLQPAMVAAISAAVTQYRQKNKISS